MWYVDPIDFGSFVYEGPSRPPALLLLALIVLVAMSALVLIGTEQGKALPSTTAAPDASPTVELDMAITPEEIQLFPTYAQMFRLTLMGTVYCDKTRPDEIRVYIEGSVDVTWDFMITPEIMLFRGVGERQYNFEIYLSIPSRTAGPPEVTMSFRAYADVVGRTVDCTAQAVVYIVQDANGFIESIPTDIQVPPDKGVDGTVYIENLLDEELEVHISATGDWEPRIPDLDFQQSIVLQPYEQRPARFHGKLSSDVEPGDHKVELALWTPGADGERTVITTVNVTLHVLEDPGDSFADSLMRVSVPLLIVTFAAMGTVTYLIINRRSQSEVQ